MSATPAAGNVVLSRSAFDGVKIFSATMFGDRAQLGEKVTSWIAENPKREVTEMVVSQSSDSSYHCISIVVFYRSLN